MDKTELLNNFRAVIKDKNIYIFKYKEGDVTNILENVITIEEALRKYNKNKNTVFCVGMIKEPELIHQIYKLFDEV